MQPRYRSSGDGMRSYSSNYRSFGRGGYNRSHSKPYALPPPPPPPPPPPRKADIFLEAGRLAAEYLVSKGLLPPDSLSGKWQNRSLQEPKSQDRELPPPEGRSSALSRLGSPVSDGHGRRRFDDDYNRASSRRGRRRGPYSRGYHSDWSRENGRDGPWMERNVRYLDSVDEEDDFAPGYHRERRSGFDDAGSSVSRVGGDERHSKSESGSENHEVVDDTGSKASSSSTRKDQLAEVDVVMSKEQGDTVKVSDNGEEVKSDACDDSEKKIQEEEDVDMHVDDAEGDYVGKHGNDLLKLCSFAKVPTRPRSSLGQRNDKVEQGPTKELKETFRETSEGADKGIAEENPTGGSSCGSHSDQDKNLEREPPNDTTVVNHQSMEEHVEFKDEHVQSLPCFETFDPADEEEVVCFERQHADKREGIKRQRDLTLSEVSQDDEDDYSRLHDFRAKRASPYVERIPSSGGHVVAAIDREKSDEAEAALKSEEEKQLEPTSFKTCDLNLMEAPEVTEIPDGPVMDDLEASESSLKAEQKALVSFGLSIGNNTNNSSDMYSRTSCDDKVVPVIDLEADSPIEETACGSSKPKNEMIYSSLENFLSHSDHADDLPGIQDGYPLEISDILGSDIAGCSSVGADLNNLQTGMGFHGGEGVPGVDDSIYGVSFGELPMGFMEVWEQQHQEFGKFF